MISRKLTAAVVTVTKGRPELDKCIASVQAQTYPVQHYLLYDNGKKLWLRKNAFREYCDRIGRNALNIIETLTKSGLIQADKKFQLGKGTKVDMGSRPPCIMLDMTHKTMAGSQPTPPSTPHPPTATQNV